MSTQTTAPAKKTYTNWEAFTKAKLRPVNIKCQGYKPTHTYDAGCKTNLTFDVDTLIEHIKRDHGGGFEMVLRVGANAWEGWNLFQSKGIEITDIKDFLTDADVRIQPGELLKYTKSRRGKNKEAQMRHNGLLAGGIPTAIFNITLGFNKPSITDDEYNQEF